MSSSKVFKKDPHFTPIPLVRHNIILPKDASEHAATSTPSSPHSPDLEPLPEPKVASLEDIPSSRVDPEPVQPVQQPPLVDIEAIRKEGYIQGMTDLKTQVQAEFQQTMAAFAMACQQIDRQRKKLLLENRGDIINLIITLSKKILGQELATPRNIIATTLQAALEQAIESEEFYVSLHPDDLSFAEKKAPELIAAIRGLEHVVFKTDTSITRGGCLLESTICSVDATIESQLESMKEYLDEHPDFLPDNDTSDQHS